MGDRSGYSLFGVTSFFSRYRQRQIPIIRK